MVEQKRDLKKILGFWDSVAITLASVIGVGIFRVPAEVAGYLKSAPLVILAWASAGIIVFFGVLCYAELSAAFPATGGNYIYLRESYGRGPAFLFGWSELLVIRTGSIAAVSFILAEYLQSFLALSKPLIKPAAVFIVLLLSAVNISGLRFGKRVQKIFVLSNISAIVTVIVLGFFSGKGSSANFFSSAAIPMQGIIVSFGLALIPILWTYGGWHESTFVAGETKDAARTLPRALLTALSLVVLLYLAVNLLYLYLMPLNRIAESKLIGSDILNILYGNIGRKIFEAMVIVSSAGCVNAMIITGSRVTYALANDNAVFRYLGEVNSRYATPHRAIIVNALWASILILLGAFNKLLFFTGILVWLFFALTASGIFILRRKFPGIARPYKVWGYPVTPVIFILICGFLFINTFIFAVIPSLFGLILLASGIPVYMMTKRLNRKIMGSELILTPLFLTIMFLGNAAYAQEEDIFFQKRNKMAEAQIKARGITDMKVITAMTKVKRHLFVPQMLRNLAYEDSPLPIGYGQTISQPYIVAYMTEAAGLNSSDRVLEIGTGSGYQAAILAEIVKEVYTIEILKPLAESAAERLQQLGYRNVLVKYGDGYKGWPEYAPFDAIIVTAAPSEIPQELVKQMKTGARMVVPIGSFFQELYLIVRTESGITKKTLLPVRFVPMVPAETNN